ncbi:unnamed protein product [Brassicogethes aeneus]|uniref:Phosphoglycerate kinase n=1 Tax=Brassicogethes aeneus TaxID=1431903 RepID=A0A9P0FP28_BRAAE|nr:unnamed protein product [Brassicogethes aeneus]
MNFNNLMSIDDLDLFDKRVLIRVDYNVPYDNEGNITDYFRIEESLKTINYCIAHRCRSIVLMSHRGRPGGKVVKDLSMEKVAKVLEKLMQRDVIFLPDPVPSRKTEAYCRYPRHGSIIVLENLRFTLGEEKTGKDWLGNKVEATKEEIKNFRKSLRRLADVYINEAFGTVHRDHSSMMGDLFETKAAGFLMKSELTHLSAVLTQSQNSRPLVCILGGNKCEEKIPLLNHMINVANEIIIGGGQAYNFLKVVHHINVGDFPTCPELEDTIKNIMIKAKKNNVKIHIPQDFYITDDMKNGEVKLADVETEIEPGWVGCDIGPKTIEVYRKTISRAKVILWNGPMGTVSYDKFCNGTRVVLDEIVKATKNGTITVAGGGRTGYCLAKWNADGQLSHVSTGGGAFLKVLEGKTFPAIKVLLQKNTSK